MIVYLAGAIQAFVMYCVNGTSRSSLLIESTDSMIVVTFDVVCMFLCFLKDNFVKPIWSTSKDTTVDIYDLFQLHIFGIKARPN